MQNDLPNLLRQLRSSPLEKVTEQVNRAHHELESAQLVCLQQAFIRLPYTIDPNALILFDEVSISLQSFVRMLLQHYILEAEIYGEASKVLATPRVDKATSNRIRHDHQSIQECLSDLQSLVAHFSEVSESPEVSRFQLLLNQLAENLHQQILAEDNVLLPRCYRN